MSDRSSGCGGDSDLEYISGSDTSSSGGDHVVIMNLNNHLVEDSDPDSTMELDEEEVYLSTDESLSGSPASSSISGNGDGDEDSGNSTNGNEGDDGSVGLGESGNEKEKSNNNGTATTANYFEGVEKLLEIWFTRLDGKVAGDTCNLRKIPRYQLEEMLKLVHCEIIDSASNDEIDSYVLSESSLFISQRRLILKTCGTTTPLQCLKFLWTLVREFTGFDCIEDVYYSHKNYKRPQVQTMPYRKFDSEVELLDDFFLGSGNPSGGSAYCLGSMNRDCWYLYTYHAPMSTKNQGVMHRRLGGSPSNATVTGARHYLGNHNPHHYQSHTATIGNKHQRVNNGRVTKPQHNNSQMILMSTMSMLMFDEPDQTLEILMSDLDQDVMKIFTQEESKSAKDATEKSGIDRIIPGMKINDHLFEPCGYSMNGIIKDPLPSKSKKNQGTYMTIHITPEQEFSYVSFETNVSMSSYNEVIGRVLNAFRPGKFVLTFFANKASKGYPAHNEMNKMDVISDHGKDQWLRMDNQFCRLEKNDLTYAMYTKFPS